jgi:hypothetical protein
MADQIYQFSGQALTDKIAKGDHFLKLMRMTRAEAMQELGTESESVFQGDPEDLIRNGWRTVDSESLECVSEFYLTGLIEAIEDLGEPTLMITRSRGWATN